MDTLNSSNSQTTVQTYDTYMPAMPEKYCDNVTTSSDQQLNISSPNHNQQYRVASTNQHDANDQQYIHQTGISNIGIGIDSHY
ncbi:unnamed protein product [Rhizophagus irregularis]|nr:unnamed protein product [Rhizophagus irregularis]